MIRLDAIKFLNSEDSLEYSKEYDTSNAESLELEISGTGSPISIEIETKIDNKNGDWVARKCINYNDLSVTKTITAKGQYVIPINGAFKTRVHNKATSKGNICVFGKLVG